MSDSPRILPLALDPADSILGRVSPAKQIQAVIFDMDGVLTDSEPLFNAAAVAMFREKGVLVQLDDLLPLIDTGEDRCIGGVAE